MNIEVRENRHDSQYILQVGDIVEELDSGNFFIAIEEYTEGKEKYILRHLIDHRGLNGYFDDLIELTDGLGDLEDEEYKIYSKSEYNLVLEKK